MQAQQGGGGTFLDQPHFIFNNNTPPGNSYKFIHRFSLLKFYVYTIANNYL